MHYRMNEVENDEHSESNDGGCQSHCGHLCGRMKKDARRNCACGVFGTIKRKRKRTALAVWIAAAEAFYFVAENNGKVCGFISGGKNRAAHGKEEDIRHLFIERSTEKKGTEQSSSKH